MAETSTAPLKHRTPTQGSLPEAISDALRDITDEALRSSFPELFDIAQKLIFGSHIDVVVLSSRRLPCMYQLLVGAGMPPLRGAQIIGDQALDFIPDPTWQRALVLDDTVILGSTLAALHTRVRSLPGIASVITRAVCLDTDQAAPYLLNSANLKALNRRDSHSVQQLSGEIIKCLYRQGVPLFSDFPVSNQLLITQERWLHFLQQDSWLIADTTAPILDELDRSALVLVPSRSYRRYSLAGLPTSITNMVEVVKIRAYVKSEHSEQVSLRLVPLCILKPATPADISKSLHELMRDVSLPALGHWLETLSREAQQRLLQFLVSSYFLFRSLSKSAVHLSSETGPQLFESLSADLSFGPRWPDILDILDGLSVLAKGDYPSAPSYSFVLDSPRPYPLLSKPGLKKIIGEQQEIVASVGLPLKPKAGEVSKVGLAFSHAVASTFGYIAETYEKPQRRAIARLGSMQRYRQELSKPERERVLGFGFTLQELGRLLTLADADDDEWGLSAISLALDIGNDLGIVVPITRYDSVRDLVYRCFRLGETAVLAAVPFGQACWGKQQYDQFTRQFFAGYPLKSYVEPLADYAEAVGAPSPRKKPRRDALPRLIRRALPGRLFQRFYGVVLDTDPGKTVLARLEAPEGSDYGLVELDWDSIVRDDRAIIQRDSSVAWTVFRRVEEGNSLRSSKLHVINEATPDPEISAARTTQLAELLLDD